MASTHQVAAQRTGQRTGQRPGQRPGRAASLALDKDSFGAIAITLFVLLIVAGPSLPSMTLALAGATMLTIGFAIAVVMWALAKPISPQAGAWDAAGLLVFLGFSAAIMCGAEAFLS